MSGRVGTAYRVGMTDPATGSVHQLSALDTQFLNVESATTVCHFGSLLLLDPSTAADGELTLDGLRDLLEPRLHLAPLLRQRLLRVPLGLGQYYLVDDPGFDIEFHLREVVLATPGDEAQLGEQIARIHARPLDRTRPLWEMYLIHGVEGGRQALYIKVHHAAIDGVTGAEILSTIMDTTVEPMLKDAPADDWMPDPLPSAAELLRRGLAAMAAEPVSALRALPRALPHVADVPGLGLIPGAEAVSDLAETAVRRMTGGDAARPVARRTLVPPPTPLNAQITAHRRFAFGSLQLDDIKRVKNAFGMTVNDVAMAVCAGALRRWLLDHDGLPVLPIVVAVPVSIRADEQPGESGNQLSVMLAEMPTQIADPAERLVAAQQAMDEAKEQFETVPPSILQDVTSVVPTAMSGLVARTVFQTIGGGALPFNLFISNIPGPQMPLYVGGACVLGIYPASVITNFTGALNITLFSYNGALDFGLIACRELLPDVGHLTDYLADALAELLALVD